jgi:uncharacterized protein YbdZ (MbtH family)
MSTTEQTLERQHIVVINHEEQYSIWFADRPIPVWSKISNVKSFPVTSDWIPCLLPDNSLFRFELAADLCAA